MSTNTIALVALGVALYVVMTPKTATAAPIPKPTSSTASTGGDSTARDAARTLTEILQGIYEAVKD